MNLFALGNRVRAYVWDSNLDTMPRLEHALVRFLRVSFMVATDLADGQLTLRAMSLVYTTLLSLVPLLAVSFSVLKGFGIHNAIEPLLHRLLQPLGEKGVELSQRIVGFVENMRVGVLGAVGLLVLFWTVVSLLQKIERSFNFIWRVPSSRNPLERFSHYVSVVVIGPVLMFAALGITASVLGTSVVQHISAVQPLGDAIRIGTGLLPYLLVIVAFTFIYGFIPNTRVHFVPALVGGVVAAVLWQSVGWGFASFVVGSARYAAIYSSFAILILFIFWLYLAWLILLTGASVAFYYQHPEYLGYLRREIRLSNRLKERVALYSMLLVAQHHYHGQPPWTTDALAQRMGVAGIALEPLLQALQREGLLLTTGDHPPAWIPGRDIGRIELREVLEVVRTHEETPHLSVRRVRPNAGVDEVLGRVQEAVHEALAERTMRDLVLASPRDEGPAPEAGMDSDSGRVPVAEVEGGRGGP